MVLNDICDVIADSFHSTVLNEGVGIPLIRTSNIGKGRFKLEGVYRVSETVYRQRILHAEPRMNDIILSRETPIGNAAIIKHEGKLCLGQRTVLIRPNPLKVYPDFLLHYLLAQPQQQKLLRFAKGTAAVHVNLSSICQMNVDNLPSLQEQRRIASILMAYDKLWETIRRQSALLSEALQRLYSEWFIRFHFPNHDKVPIGNGTPKGWKIMTLNDICSIIVGSTPPTGKRSFYEGGTIKFVTLTDVSRLMSFALANTKKKITEDSLNNSTAVLVPSEAILISNRVNVGLLAVCPTPVCTNQGFFACVPKINDSQMYLLCNLQNRIEALRKSASGLDIPNITRTAFGKQAILLPPDSILTQYQKFSHTFLEKLMLFQKQADAVMAAKDSMLSKLMRR